MHERITHHVGDDCPGGHMEDEIDRFERENRDLRALLVDVRAFLSDVATDYDLADHAFTHVLLGRFTERIDAATMEERHGR